jgi:hypothetical protein
MSLIKGLLYWGYLDDSGIIHVKRYTSDREIRNYESLPFCKGIFDPFESFDIQEAKHKCLQRLNEEKYFEKKN